LKNEKIKDTELTFLRFWKRSEINEEIWSPAHLFDKNLTLGKISHFSSYFVPFDKILSFCKTKKIINKFLFFCFALTYSYLCT